MQAHNKTALNMEGGAAATSSAVQSEFQALRSDFEHNLHRLLTLDETPSVELELESIFAIVELLRDGAEKMLALNQTLMAELGAARQRVEQLETERHTLLRRLDGIEDQRSPRRAPAPSGLDPTHGGVAQATLDQHSAEVRRAGDSGFDDEIDALFEGIRAELNTRDHEIFKARKTIDDLLAKVVTLFEGTCRLDQSAASMADSRDPEGG